jgi:hypothetical protein
MERFIGVPRWCTTIILAQIQVRVLSGLQLGDAVLEVADIFYGGLSNGKLLIQ